MSYPNPALDLMDAIEDRLNSDPYFSNIYIINSHDYTTRNDDVDRKIQECLAPTAVKGGDSGICVVVHYPEAEVISENIHGPLLSFKCMIEVVEAVNQNFSATGTSKHSSTVAQRIANTTHLLATIPQFGLLHCPVGESITPYPPIVGEMGYTVTIHCPIAQHALFYKVAPVVFSPTSGATPLSVTMTCSTGSAGIYYTTNGAWPTTSSTLYSTPVALAAATTLRACAYYSDYVPSNLTQGSYT